MLGYVRQAALERADKLAPKVLENLRELCSFGPDDGEACAAKVGCYDSPFEYRQLSINWFSVGFQ